MAISRAASPIVLRPAFYACRAFRGRLTTHGKAKRNKRAKGAARESVEGPSQPTAFLRSRRSASERKKRKSGPRARLSGFQGGWEGGIKRRGAEVPRRCLNWGVRRRFGSLQTIPFGDAVPVRARVRPDPAPRSHPPKSHR